MASSRPTDEERIRFNHIDPRRRREDLYIKRIRESNPDVFAEVSRRFIRGESLASVATWVWHLKPRGYLSTCGYGTIRNYLHPLRMRIREQLRDRAEQVHSVPPPPAVPRRPSNTEQVIEAVNETVRQIEAPRPAHVTDELKLMVDKRVAEIQGLEMLKYLFFQQDKRLRRHLTLEADGNGVLTTEGSMTVDVMRRIAEAVCKVELADSLISVKRLHQGINPMTADANGPNPPSDQADDVIRRFENLQPADKNLMREAGTKFIDMIREEVGGFKASGLGSADAPDQRQATGIPKNS